MLEVVRQKHLVLIIAREFASNLATPTLISDADGTLIFYNEAAEQVIGVPFAESGEVPIDDLTATFSPRTQEGEPVPPERMPVRTALAHKQPVHMTYRVTSRDGVDRDAAVTAFPLFGQAEEFVGIMAIFWREE